MGIASAATMVNEPPKERKDLSLTEIIKKDNGTRTLLESETTSKVMYTQRERERERERESEGFDLRCVRLRVCVFLCNGRCTHTHTHTHTHYKQRFLHDFGIERVNAQCWWWKKRSVRTS